MDILREVTANPYFQLSYKLCGLFLLILWFALIFWTYRDAQRRGALAAYWALVVFFFNVFGWIVYLIIRPPELLDDARERDLEIKAKESVLAQSDLTCPACLKPVEKDFLICPYCTKKLKKSCPECGRALKMSWTVCPYCKAEL